MSRLRKFLAWICLVLTPISTLLTRVVPLGNQIGSAKQVATTAAGVVGGAAGTVIAIRGCRCARRVVTLGDDTGRLAFKLSDDVLRRNPTLERVPFMTLDELGVTATRQGRWESFSKVVGETSAGRGLSAGELKMRWRSDPVFRSRIFAEISTKHPEQLRVLKKDLLFRHRASSWLKLMNPQKVIAAAVEKEPVVLFDAFGNPLRKSIAEATEFEYRLRAKQIFNEILIDVPKKSLKSEADLKNAFRKAFESRPKAEYSLDVSTGKLELKFKTKHGEITGGINAYSIAAKLAAASGAGYWAFYELLSEGDVNSTPQKEADAPQLQIPDGF